MPLIRDTLSAGQQYDGTAGRGLLAPHRNSSPTSRAKVVSLQFTCASAVAITVEVVEADTGDTSAVLLNGSHANAVLNYPVLLPSDDDGDSYELRVSTAALPGDATLTIDWLYGDLA